MLHADIVILGTGLTAQPLSSDAQDALQQASINYEALDTVWQEMHVTISASSDAHAHLGAEVHMLVALEMASQCRPQLPHSAVPDCLASLLLTAHRWDIPSETP